MLSLERAVKGKYVTVYKGVVRGSFAACFQSVILGSADAKTRGEECVCLAC